MPERSDYFLVASITKIHGIKGEFKISFDSDNHLNYLNKEFFYVEKNGQFFSFHVDYIRPFQKSFIIKFNEIQDRTSAEAFLHAKLYLPISELPQLEKDTQFYYHEIVSATVVDEYYGETGIVKEVVQMPAQDLIVILYKNKEILLPITDETIVRWDRNQKNLYTKFPKGLREIYL